MKGGCRTWCKMSELHGYSKSQASRVSVTPHSAKGVAAKLITATIKKGKKKNG